MAQAVCAEESVTEKGIEVDIMQEELPCVGLYRLTQRSKLYKEGVKLIRGEIGTSSQDLPQPVRQQPACMLLFSRGHACCVVPRIRMPRALARGRRPPGR